MLKTIIFSGTVFKTSTTRPISGANVLKWPVLINHIGVSGQTLNQM
jgi:hypothetical protein